MDIKRTPILFRGLSTNAASVPVALPGGAHLLCPVWTIVAIIAALVEWVVIAKHLAVFAAPFPLTRVVAELLFVGVCLASVALQLSPAVCAGDSNHPAVRTVVPRSVRGLPFATASAIAELVFVVTNAVGVALQKLPALGAWHGDHRIVSLIKTPDVWRWGRLASGTSGSERFMTPFLALHHYTTFGIKTPQTALMIDSNQEADDTDERERAGGLKAAEDRKRVLLMELDLLALENSPHE